MAKAKKDTGGVATATAEDRYGNQYEVEAGMDGENPVTPENPPAKAVLGVPSSREAALIVTDEDTEVSPFEESARASRDAATQVVEERQAAAKEAADQAAEKEKAASK